MAGYIGSGASVVSSGVENKKVFDITTNTTSLTGLNYTVGKVHVYHNGVRLVDGTDFTATNSTSITLTVAAVSGDQVVVVSFASFQVADALLTSGGTMTGNLTVQGTVAATAYTGDGSALTGTGSPSIDDNGNATAITIDSSEKVGIGDTSPSARLEIGGMAAGEQALLIQSGRNDALSNGLARINITDANCPFAGLQVDHAGTGAAIIANGNVGIGGTPDSGRKLHIEGGDASVGITLKDTAGGQFGINSDGGNLIFKSDSANSERMRILSSGAKNFGAFKTENGGYNLYAGAADAGSYAARFDGTGTAASNVLQFVNGYGEVGSIKIASNGTTTNFNTGSDYRLKTDVQPVTNASARIQSLNPVNFEWIRSGTRTDGFLAHEAQAVVPDCVSGDKDAMKDEGYEVTPATGDIYTPATDEVDEVIHSADAEQPETLEDGQQWRETTAAVMGTRSVPDYQGIDQSKLVPLLTAALQEALTEIASLKTRVEALEGV